VSLSNGWIATARFAHLAMTIISQTAPSLAARDRRSTPRFVQMEFRAS
jgi:hypothetical protein